MTIAAGFPYRDGVLLCADSQQEGGALKFFSPKVKRFAIDPAVGCIGAAFAGNSAFATAAMQKCEDAIRQVKNPDKIASVLETTAAAEYSKTVSRHPDRKSWEIPYWLLFSVWNPTHGTSLFVTEDISFRKVDDYECVGIGRDLAHYLVHPVFQAGALSESRVLVMASYMLARVTACVPGCGGPYTFLAVRNDGSSDFVSPEHIPLVDNQSEEFQSRSQRLFFDAISHEISEEDFQGQIDQFAFYLKNARETAILLKDLRG